MVGRPVVGECLRLVIYWSTFGRCLKYTVISRPSARKCLRFFVGPRPTVGKCWKHSLASRTGVGKCLRHVVGHRPTVGRCWKIFVCAVPACRCFKITAAARLSTERWL